MYLFAQNLVEYHRQRLKYHVHDKSFLTLQNTLEQANSVEEYLAPLKEMFAKYVPADEVACIVIETIQEVHHRLVSFQ
jgi:4-aminobutyrate aminotransferase-like enzyme